MKKTLALVTAFSALMLLSACSVNPWNCVRPVAAGAGPPATGALDTCDDDVCLRPAVSVGLVPESFDAYAR